MKTIKAVGEHVFVKPIIFEEKTEGGLIVPPVGTNKPNIFAEVLSVGPEVGEITKVGDIIVCHQNGGQIVLLDQIMYKILKKTEIYGTLKTTEEK